MPKGWPYRVGRRMTSVGFPSSRRISGYVPPPPPPPPPAGDGLMIEAGDLLVTESGDRILLE